MNKKAILLGCLFAALGVIIGAFAAHGLKPKMDEYQIQTMETGVRYQMYHAFGLLIVGILQLVKPTQSLNLSTIFFTLGILFFSGSLYAIALLKMNGIVGIGSIGMITPIGGLFFILGWIITAIAAIKNK
jgi:uncharacterized membrane protein YgdD (TMEM256/DUF423 family)